MILNGWFGHLDTWLWIGLAWLWLSVFCGLLFGAWAWWREGQER